MDNYEIRNQEIEAKLKDIGHALKDQMPDGYGFTLLLFSYEGQELFYISSAQRTDMIKTMEEFVQRQRRGRN